MRKLKRTLALALAFVLTFAMSVTAFATQTDSDNDGSYTITITNSAAGHTYEAYQIFAGDLSESDGVKTLSNVKWGNGVASVGGVAVEAGSDASEEAEKVAQLNSAAELNDYVNTLTLTTPEGTSTETKGDTGSTYVISGLAAGYYVVKDQDGSVTAEGDAYTSYIVQVVGDVEQAAKSSTTTSQKKVKDVNDSTGEGSDWQDSADYDIGDVVPFQLTGIITEKYDDYDTYYLAFHDTESKGLTFDPESVVVKIDGTEVDSSLYKVVTEGVEGTFDVVFEDLKATAAKAESVVTVEYSSTLNEDAVLGSQGNPNTMYLEYSNNPNVTGEGTPSTGTTPEDTVIVFTYKVVINKVDQNGDALKGAAFALYKKDASVTADTEGYKKISDAYYKVIAFAEGDDTTVFTFSGLDDGDYILSETDTPSGYNSIADIKFTVTADHDILADDPQLTSLSGSTESGLIEFTLSVSEGSLTSDVVNQSGSVLPSTGGTGRVLLYVVGALLVVGVGVILVAKKRAQ
jgi:fimbrial isopeptide formation D2 family protein/LPXTG-motif cell wall-anchored protein